MNFMALKRMIAGFEEEASQCGLDLEKVDVLVSLDVDGVLGKDEVGNRIFGKTEDWSFDSLDKQFVIRAEYESDSGIRISKSNEDKTSCKFK